MVCVPRQRGRSNNFHNQIKMSRFWLLLCVALILDMVCDANGGKKKPKKLKKMRPTDMVNQLNSLQKNVSTLWSEVKEMGSSRVNVHVHGIGEEDAHEDEDGTHVHIHMHMDDPMTAMHKKHMGHMHHGSMGDHVEGDGHDGGHTIHGFHGMPEGKKMMHFMHEHMHFPMSMDEYVYGHCEMAMNPVLKKSPHKIKGGVHFRQKMHGPLEMLIHLKGFNMPKGSHMDHSHMHGFHVHEFGDLSNGCQSFGGHYDPDGVEHSGKSSESRHAGDWGNIACDEEGEVHITTNDTMVSLIGTHSILGRGIVIHADVDDLGEGGVQASKKTGNAGGRLACCVVARAGEHDWNMLEKHQH